MDGWMDGWMGGWMRDGRSAYRIAMLKTEVKVLDIELQVRKDELLMIDPILILVPKGRELRGAGVKCKRRASDNGSVQFPGRERGRVRCVLVLGSSSI